MFTHTNICLGLKITSKFLAVLAQYTLQGEQKLTVDCVVEAYKNADRNGYKLSGVYD